MLEIVGPNTRRPIRAAVAIRILDNMDDTQLRFLQRHPGRLVMNASGAVAAINKARETYRCRSARKELNAMRADGIQALQNQYNQSLSIIGPEEEVRELYAHLQLSLLKAA